MSAGLVLASHCAASETIDGGYEIHRQGSSPHARQIAAMQRDAAEAQCRRAGELCAMIGSTQGEARGAECLARMRPGPFELVGRLDTVGDYEVTEYHHPGLHKSSVTKRIAELVPVSACRLEILQRETTTLIHYGPQRRTLLTRVIDPRRGAQPWFSQTLPKLDAGSIALVRQALALDSLAPLGSQAGGTSVAGTPGPDDARIAGRDCRWMDTPPPMRGRVCLLRQGIGMPINESLGAEISGPGEEGPVVLLREQVVRFRGPVELPARAFEPDDIVARPGHPPDATGVRCARTTAPAGIDPCTELADEPVDD